VHMDITPLLKMHRPELLQHHLKKIMHMEYTNEHFQRSIILPHVKSTQQASAVANQLVNTASSLPMRKRTACSQPPVACPVTGCFTQFKVPKKEVLLQHIKKEHPKKVTSKKTLQAVDMLFPKKSSLRKNCEDCGLEISVYSNKHKGSAKCLQMSYKLVQKKDRNGTVDDRDNSEDA